MWKKSGLNSVYSNDNQVNPIVHKKQIPNIIKTNLDKKDNFTPHTNNKTNITNVVENLNKYIEEIFPKQGFPDLNRSDLSG